jgi:F0F1-type ATP synthase assembly protein I
MKGDPKEWAEPLRLLLTVGWYVALSLVIPVAIGYWLDQPQMFNRSPLFTFIGLGVGTFISFFGLIRILIRYKTEQDALNKEKKNEFRLEGEKKNNLTAPTTETGNGKREGET